MKNIGITLLFIILTHWAFGQFSEIPNRFVDESALFSSWRNNIALVGTPYLDTAFVDAEFVSQNEIFKAPIRYDVVSDAFEANYEGKQLRLNVDFVDLVTIGSAQFFYQYFEGSKKVFELLGQNGDKKLIKKHKRIFSQAVTGVPYQEDKPARFEDLAPRYFLTEGGQIKVEVSNYKALYKYFPERKKELQEFIKKGKIQRESDEDMKKLFAIL